MHSPAGILLYGLIALGRTQVSAPDRARCETSATKSESASVTPSGIRVLTCRWQAETHGRQDERQAESIVTQSTVGSTPKELPYEVRKNMDVPEAIYGTLVSSLSSTYQSALQTHSADAD